MDFAGLNYIAIPVAAIAAFIFGAAYYGLLGKAWMKAARVDPDKQKMSAMPFIVSFVALIVMAWVMAGVIGHLGAGQVTPWNGFISGAFLWLGFMATTTAIAQRYQGFGWNLTLIDAGHWLGVALIMGGVIGWMGV